MKHFNLKFNLPVILLVFTILLVQVGCSSNSSSTPNNDDPFFSANSTSNSTTSETPLLSEAEFAAEEEKADKIIADQDLKACDDLKSVNLQILCKDQTILALVQSNSLDQVSCEDIKDNSTKDFCLTLNKED